MKLRITVEGVAYEVEVEVLDEGAGAPAPSAPARPIAAPAPGPTPTPPASTAAKTAPPATLDSDKVCKSPIAGSILEVKVKPGDAVKLNQIIAVMEAMKMETNIASPVEGTVAAVHVQVGDAVKQGQLLAEFE